MKRAFLIFLYSVFTLSCYSQTICEGQVYIPTQPFNLCNDSQWELDFTEDFNLDSLDLETWKYGPRIRICNPEQQYYTKGNNIEIEDGVLKIFAKRDTTYARAVDWKADFDTVICNGKSKGINLRYFYYTSGNIETIQTFGFGKFEARVKIPKGKGFWPAFWTYSGAPYNEIDIFEFWNEDNFWGKYDPDLLSRVHHMNTFYDYDLDGSGNSCLTGYKDIDLSKDFHIFTLIWEPNKIQWFVDGDLKRTHYRFYTILGESVDCSIDAFKEYSRNLTYPVDSMRVILNLAIQKGTDDLGNNNSPDNSTVFPACMEVDWVKHYKRQSNIKDIPKNISFSFIYPNPANEYVSLEIFGDLISNCKLEIYNLNFNLVEEYSINSSISRVDTRKLDNGIYFFRIINNESFEQNFHRVIIAK